MALADVHIDAADGTAGLDAATSPPRERILTVDRTRAFERARRHSWLVKSLKIILPLTAVGASIFYVGQVVLTARIGGAIDQKRPGITISRELTMDRPRYEGATKDGGTFLVTAVSALPELSNTNRIKLNSITGELFDARRQRTDITAGRGVYDSKANVLDLSDGITVVNPAGMKAELETARIETKEGRLATDRPARVTGPQGKVRSDRLELDQKSKRIGFIGGVVANLTPPPKPDKPVDENIAAPARSAGVTAFAGAGTPIDVNSDRLDIDDTGKTAVFSGKVRAVQMPPIPNQIGQGASNPMAGSGAGPATIETERMEISYAGQAAGTATAAGGTPTSAPTIEPSAAVPPRPSAPPPEPARIERIVMPVPLVITQPGGTRVSGNAAEFDVARDVAVISGSVQMASGADRRATADRIEFNQRADTILLTGAVVVTQAQSEVRGRRLFLDRKSGRTEVASPAEAGLPKSRMFARLMQNARPDTPATAAKKAVTPAVQAVGEIADQTGFGLTTFRTDPNAPVEVEADKLVVEDQKKEAVFTGDVRSTQGDFRLRSNEMKAFYSGDTGLVNDPASTTASAAAGSRQTQLEKLEARGKVVVTSKANQQVTGDWAIFDTKANVVTIGGTEVVITQGPNIVKGSKLVIDMTTGQSVMTRDGPSVAVSGTVPTGQQIAPTRPGRSSLTLYPSTLEKSKKSTSDGTAKPADASPAASPAPAGTARPSSSSWGATTEPVRPR